MKLNGSCDDAELGRCDLHSSGISAIPNSQHLHVQVKYYGGGVEIYGRTLKIEKQLLVTPLSACLKKNDHFQKLLLGGGANIFDHCWYQVQQKSPPRFRNIGHVYMCTLNMH